MTVCAPCSRLACASWGLTSAWYCIPNIAECEVVLRLGTSGAPPPTGMLSVPATLEGCWAPNYSGVLLSRSAFSMFAICGLAPRARHKSACLSATMAWQSIWPVGTRRKLLASRCCWRQAALSWLARRSAAVCRYSCCKKGRLVCIRGRYCFN